MRSYRFRAWHQGFFGIGPLMVYDDKIGDCFYMKLREDPVTLMQSTGSVDLQGKEIFEGDIVDLVVKNLAIPVRAEVKWHPETNGFYYATIHSEFPHVRPEQAVDIRVIGNIYEHKELLNREY